MKYKFRFISLGWKVRKISKPSSMDIEQALPLVKSLLCRSWLREISLVVKSGM